MDPVAPEEVGLSSARLARVVEHLDRSYVGPGKVAGTLTLVARRGRIAFLEAQGRMDLERGKPMQDDTIFRIYSMTKPVTSVALMSLYEEGRFQLADPVHKYIPEWRDLRVFQGGKYPQFLTRPCERPMTVRDLFTHMSGLTYGFMQSTNVDSAYRRLRVQGEDGGTLRDMVEKLARLPLEFSPGTAWNYSVSTDVLAHLVEVISGKRFDEFLQDRIFGPLRMADTGFTVPPEKIERFAANYGRRADKSLRLEDDPHDSPYIRPRSFLSGGGGLVSTARDYFRFCQMLLAGGELDGARVLGRKTIELMTRNHLPPGRDLADLARGYFSEVSNEGTGFGLGFSVILDPAHAQVIGSPGEYAWGGAASTIFWIDPAEELIVVFMTQLMPSRTFNFRGQLKSIVYPAIID